MGLTDEDESVLVSLETPNLYTSESQLENLQDFLRCYSVHLFVYLYSV